MLKTDAPDAPIKITYAGLAKPQSPKNHSVSHYVKSEESSLDEDLYAIGIMTYELLSGGRQPPISGDQYWNDEASNGLELGNMNDFSRDAQDFVTQCLLQQPFSVKQALEHVWLEENLPEDVVEAGNDDESQVIISSVGDDVASVLDDSLVSESTMGHSILTGDGVSLLEPRTILPMSDALDETPVIRDGVDRKENVTPALLNERPSESGSTPTKPVLKDRDVTSSVPQLERIDESQSATTPAEFEDLRDVFKDVESVQSGGAVTVGDLKQSLRKKYTAEEVDSWLSDAKLQDTSTVKYKEVLARAIRSRRHLDLQRVKEAFEKIDKGRQGFVTVGNLRAVLGTDNSENIEQIMKEANTKKDGRISYEKFQEVVNQWHGTD